MVRKRQTVNFKKNAFETAAWEAQSVVVGIDEVGRGCLAGPLVTAAVVLPPYKISPMLKDSKLMTHQERVKAFNWIDKHCWYGTGIVHNRLIDKHNIWQATLIAMKKALIHALQACPHQPSAIVIDAMPLNLFDTAFYTIPVHHFPFGEKKSSSIAAASIVAKVKRDALMDMFDDIIPGYNWKDNKGYATKAHKTALSLHSHSLLHRLNYLNTESKDLGSGEIE